MLGWITSEFYMLFLQRKSPSDLFSLGQTLPGFGVVTIITGVLGRTRRRSELSNFKMAVQQQLFNP